MKDYNLIKYIGKKIGYCKEDKKANTVQINFTYKDALFSVFYEFKNKVAVKMTIALNQIYERYGKSKYSSVKEFAKAYTDKYSFFTTFHGDEIYFLESDLRKNKVDNVLSVGLANLQVFTSITNEVLNQNLDTFDEAETKEWYKSYLKDEKLTAKKFTIGSAITFGVSFILCIIFGSGNVAFIFFLLSFVSFICLVLFGGKFLYYSKKLK